MCWTAWPKMLWLYINIDCIIILIVNVWSSIYFEPSCSETLHVCKWTQCRAAPCNMQSYASFIKLNHLWLDNDISVLLWLIMQPYIQLPVSIGNMSTDHDRIVFSLHPAWYQMHTNDCDKLVCSALEPFVSLYLKRHSHRQAPLFISSGLTGL